METINPPLYTAKEMISFGKYLCSEGRMLNVLFSDKEGEDGYERVHQVYHADICNWEILRKTDDV